ncbi:MAG: hypothetical protein ABIO94_00440 [Opitutaceae bacterium]
MKKTAAELSESIPVVATVENFVVKMKAACPLCGQLFCFSTHEDIVQMRASTINSVITHIRCLHPED